MASSHTTTNEYQNKGSPEVAQKVIERLQGAGFEAEKLKRGLDHGVWVGFVAGKTIVLFLD